MDFTSQYWGEILKYGLLAAGPLFLLIRLLLRG
jgi:hypothetical protein